MKIKSLFALCLCTLSLVVNTQGKKFEDVEIRVESVADGLYVLMGEGGNIGLSVGGDGVFIIDDQFAPLSTKILAAIKSISDQPLRFVVNTHWHGDHTGGNENMAQQGAIIVAHDNVRQRLLTGSNNGGVSGDRKIPPAAKAALPVVTFAHSMSFHWNNETLLVEHIQPGHTDGDAVIYFENANAVHMGDIYFNGIYPFIDPGSGGSALGMIASVDSVLAKIDDDTKLIPGHGAVSNKAELLEYREMLAASQSKVASLADSGKNLKQIIAAKPTADFDAKWGGGFMSPERFVTVLFETL